MFKRIPGTKDILPPETGWWQQAEETAREVFSLYNYRQIRPPLVEEIALFNRSLGQTTEIVQKQMFVIKNDADTYALRPEGTAGVVRAYIENNVDKTDGFAKYYYLGPMFRLERPQKGRLRQFHHIGCEAIGAGDPALDAEVIALADHLLKRLSISGYQIKVNNLGCLKDKTELAASLRRKIKDNLPKFCAECHNRFKTNVLRILDCKNADCKEAVRGLDIGEEHLCQGCRDHFSGVRNILDALNIGYEAVPQLVRGLDYYTGTVFEISHADLGAQDALGAGGRYDNLVKDLGGPEASAVGFAFGVERLYLVRPADSQENSKNLVYIVTLGDAARAAGIKLLDSLRKNAIAADANYEGKSLKSAMRKANDLGANVVLIIGDDELKKNVVMFKDMESGEQKEISVGGLIEELKG